MRGPRWGFWGYLEFLVLNTQGSESASPETERLHHGAPGPHPLPPGPLKPACTPASPRLTEPKQSCLTVEQADKRQVLLLGPGIRKSLSHPSNQCAGAHCVPVTVLSTGDSEFRKNPHHSAPNAACLHPRVGVSGLSEEALATCAHALLEAWASRALSTEHNPPPPALPQGPVAHTLGRPGYRLGLVESQPDTARQSGSLLPSPSGVSKCFLLASKPTSHRGGPSMLFLGEPGTSSFSRPLCPSPPF